MTWEEVHKTIDKMSEWERGWYHGCIYTLFFASSRDGEAPYTLTLPVDWDGEQWVIARYSPSGSQQHTGDFYSPDPTDAPDLTTIVFDHKKFQAVFMELDSEAPLFYYKLVHTTSWYQDVGHKWHTLEILIACTEDNYGIPEDWDNKPWPSIDEIYYAVEVKH